MKKVMVVDDDPENNLSLKVGLEEIDKDVEVMCADSAKECLKLLGEEKIPDIILLDIMMPDINGWEVLATLKKNSKWNISGVKTAKK